MENKQYEILERYANKIKELHECPADVIMLSVWKNILVEFYIEVEQSLTICPPKK